MNSINLVGIRFNTNKFRLSFSYFYSFLFKKVNIYFFSILEKVNFIFKFNLKKNDVLIKTIACGYCGTDKKILSFDFSFLSSAFLDSPKHKNSHIYLGHELVGIISKKGSGVKNFKVGDRVVVDSVNRTKFKNIENQLGGFQSYLIRNQKQVIKVNKKLEDDKAILIEPLSCSFGAIKKTSIKKGNTILIIGAGVIAQGIIILLRYLYKNDVKIVVATKSKLHYELLRKKKIKIDNLIFKNDIFKESKKILKCKLNSSFLNRNLSTGYDVIFECSGSSEMIDNSIRLANKNGQIIFVGMNMKLVKIDPTPIWHRNIILKGSLHYKFKYNDLKKNTMEYIQDLIIRKKILINHIKVKKFSLRNWKKVFNNQNYNSVKKAIVFKN